jgi:hypothetical protein
MIKIDSYSFGEIVIDKKKFTKDLIISKKEIKSNWWRLEGHRLHIEDLNFVIKNKPQILIVGTGVYGRMEVPPLLITILRDKYQIEVFSAPTAKAIELFKEYYSKHDNVMGAFHLTC